VNRATVRYEAQRSVAPELVADLAQVANERPRFGYRRLHVMVKRKGWTVNRKLVLRLVRENGWLVGRKLRKKLASVPRVELGHLDYRSRSAPCAGCSGSRRHRRRGIG
jgi:putative transposase